MNSGECLADLQEEVVVVSESAGSPFDHLDLVVDALQNARIERPAAMREDSGQISFETTGELFERLDPAPNRSRVLLPPESFGCAFVRVIPKVFEILFQEVSRRELAVCLQ